MHLVCFQNVYTRVIKLTITQSLVRLPIYRRLGPCFLSDVNWSIAESHETFFGMFTWASCIYAFGIVLTRSGLQLFALCEKTTETTSYISSKNSKKAMTDTPSQSPACPPRSDSKSETCAQIRSVEMQNRQQMGSWWTSVFR